MKLSLLISLLFVGLASGQKDPNRFKKAPSKPAVLETAIRSLTHLELSKETLKSWQDRHPGETLSKNHVQSWLDSGEANLINQSMLTGFVTPEKNFEHTQDIAKEYIWPTTLLPSKFEHEWPMPTEFDHRTLGISWGVSFESSQDEITDRLQASYVSILGNHFESQLVQETHQAGDHWTTSFQRSKFDEDDRTSPIQIDTSSHPDKAILLLSDVQKIILPEIPKNQDANPQSFTISPSYIKVPHADWTTFSKGREMKDLIVDTAAWAADLISQKKGSLLYSPSIMLGLGHNGTSENIDEVIYATDYFRSLFPEPLSRTNQPLPCAFDTKNIGLSLELYLDSFSSGYLILHYTSYQCSYFGKAVCHRYFDGKDWIADAWMPRFSRISQKGIVALAPGQNTLVGVSSAIDDQGNPDPANRLLFFLKAE